MAMQFHPKPLPDPELVDSCKSIISNLHLLTPLTAKAVHPNNNLLQRKVELELFIEHSCRYIQTLIALEGHLPAEYNPLLDFLIQSLEEYSSHFNQKFYWLRKDGIVHKPVQEQIDNYYIQNNPLTPEQQATFAELRKQQSDLAKMMHPDATDPIK